jgi:hypothetical protein
MGFSFFNPPDWVVVEGFFAEAGDVALVSYWAWAGIASWSSTERVRLCQGGGLPAQEGGMGDQVHEILTHFFSARALTGFKSAPYLGHLDERLLCQPLGWMGQPGFTNLEGGEAG